MSTPNACWRKSSRSGHEGGECVEVAAFTPTIAVRDSKDPDGPRLAFGAGEWRAFACRVKSSEFDREMNRIKSCLDAGRTPFGYEVYNREQVASGEWLA